MGGIQASPGSLFRLHVTFFPESCSSASEFLRNVPCWVPPLSPERGYQLSQECYFSALHTCTGGVSFLIGTGAIGFGEVQLAAPECASVPKGTPPPSKFAVYDSLSSFRKQNTHIDDRGRPLVPFSSSS